MLRVLTLPSRQTLRRVTSTSRGGKVETINHLQGIYDSNAPRSSERHIYSTYSHSHRSHGDRKHGHVKHSHRKYGGGSSSRSHGTSVSPSSTALSFTTNSSMADSILTTFSIADNSSLSVDLVDSTENNNEKKVSVGSGKTTSEKKPLLNEPISESRDLSNLRREKSREDSEFPNTSHHSRSSPETRSPSSLPSAQSVHVPPTSVIASSAYGGRQSVSSPVGSDDSCPSPPSLSPINRQDGEHQMSQPNASDEPGLGINSQFQSSSEAGTTEESGSGEDDYINSQPENFLYHCADLDFERCDYEDVMKGILHHTKQDFVDLLMKEFQSIIPFLEAGNDRSSTSGSGHTSSAGSSENSSSKPVSHKRAYNNTDEDSENSEELGKQGPKHPKASSSIPETSDEGFKFSCPYRKHNPRKYNVQDWMTCARSPLRKVARVKYIAFLSCVC